MAVCLDTRPDRACIILERFERSSLFHLLYKTQREMHLPSRVNLLVDVAEGMTYLHKVSVVHGFLNSLSVFIDEKMRAKVGNLEYSQEIGQKVAQFHQCHQVHENWKSPHQLLCKPASAACDVFRFVDSILRAFSSNDDVNLVWKLSVCHLSEYERTEIVNLLARTGGLCLSKKDYGYTFQIFNVDCFESVLS